MRLLVCGGRNYTDKAALHARLEEISPKLIIEGGASGADTIARDWASRNGIPCMTFYAPWSAMGKSAGPTRNSWMLTYGRPDAVLAMPGGKGTQSMVILATKAGILVL